MARGRKFVPSPNADGNWFAHRGLDDTMCNGEFTTSTGSMLTAPFSADITKRRPMPPPPPFRAKTDLNYKTSNKFSMHDNRHAFQDHGVYFGDGKDERTLGRKIMLPEVRLHHTDKTFLKHHDRKAIDHDLNTNYGISYDKKDSDNTTRRRYPRRYKTPPSGPIRLDTTTTNWFRHPDVPHRTPTHVLAISQEPFLKHNPWKYSNHGMKKIYPPYDRQNEPLVNNQFNKYGAAYAMGSE